jgi:VWFA-related protein
MRCPGNPASVLLLAGLGAVLAVTPTSAQEPPRFAVDVDLVVVDAVVLDSDGWPVGGLAREDFELRDEGEPREILSFEALDVSTRPASSSHEVRRVSTNESFSPQDVVAVLWDDSHLSPLAAERAKSALRAWLVGRLRLGTRVVVASTGGVWYVADSLQGTEGLGAVLDGLGGRKLAEPTRDQISDAEAIAISERSDALTFGVVRRRFVSLGVLGCDQERPALAPPAMGGEMPRIDTIDPRDRCPVLARARQAAFPARARVRATLEALTRLVDVLAVAKGRKSVLLVSEGFVADSSPRESFRAVARAAQRANAVVSFLDPTGLQTPPGMTADEEGLLPAGDHALAQSLVEADRAGSEEVARETGGLVLRSNSLLEGLGRVERDARTYYLLGFAPTPDATPGKLRRITVTVRRPGFEVRARRGYAVGSGLPRSDEEALQRLVAAPFDVGGYPVRVADWVLGPRPADKAHVVLGVDVAYPPAARGPEGRERKCDLVADVQGTDGRWREEKTLVFRPLGGADDTTKPVWYPTRFDLELPAGDYRARVVVRETGGPGVGAVAHDFEVPPPGEWRISSPVLTDALRTSLETGSPATVAVTRRQFEVGTTLEGTFDVYGSARDPKTGGVRLRGAWGLRPSGDAAASRSGPVTLEKVSEEEASCRLRAPLDLAVGDYELVLRVRDDIAGHEVEDVEAITLVPPTDEAGLASGAASVTGGEESPRPTDPVLARLLEKAGRYVVGYEQRFSRIVAEEEYVQSVSPHSRMISHFPNPSGAAPLEPGRRRVTRADLVFVRLGDELLWGTFRDVFEVDGKKVRDRDARLERLFLQPDSSGMERARQIMRESAAYNIGPVVRTINLPTLPLVFLHPRNQGRFAFERKGERQIEGVRGVEVRFEETARPTLVRRARGADLPAEGSFWIDPVRGTVLRTETRFQFAPGRGTAFVATDYRPEPRLAMWVPSEMREEYRDSGATARYSNFRRFGVNVRENARLPETAEP